MAPHSSFEATPTMQQIQHMPHKPIKPMGPEWQAIWIKSSGLSRDWLEVQNPGSPAARSAVRGAWRRDTIPLVGAPVISYESSIDHSRRFQDVGLRNHLSPIQPPVPGL
jgi:hypothetical protein